MCFYFQEIINKIINLLSQTQTNELNIEKEINKRLNDWQVEMYTRNPHLSKIPEERILQKKKEIRSILSIK